MVSNPDKTMEKLNRAVQWWREGVVWLGALCVKKKKMVQEGGDGQLSKTAQWLGEERPRTGRWLWQDVVW